MRDVDGDLAALFFGIGLDEITDAVVKDVMTQYVVSAREDDPVTAVAEKMLNHEIHHVPVVNARNKVVGFISSMDLVKAIGTPVGA
jgi:CBS domain-containing protein